MMNGEQARQEAGHHVRQNSATAFFHGGAALLSPAGLVARQLHDDSANGTGGTTGLVDASTSSSPIRTRVSSTIEYDSAPSASLRDVCGEGQQQQQHSPPSSSSGSLFTCDGGGGGGSSRLPRQKHGGSEADVPPRDGGDENGTNGATADDNNGRLVAVRYFLDRPGYGLHNSAVRLWFDPPAICTPVNLQQFLHDQGIALQDLIVEVFLDKFQSFMLLQACEAAAIEWNLHDTTTQNPGIFNIRLTDVTDAQQLDQDASLSKSETSSTGPGAAAARLQQPPQVTPAPQHANTTPVGLFSFSIMVGLETATVMGKLEPDFVSASFVLAWGPYMFFSGGLLMLVTGTLQVLRNNIYGAVAFLCFGSFWFSQGCKVILETYFAGPGTVAAELVDDTDPWGALIRACYVLAFTLALLKQTLVMSKLSTILMALLCLKVVCQAVSGWSDVAAWMQVVFGWLTSWFAFYIFLVEFTNQVYQREVFQTHKWSLQNSPEEVFGAAGKSQTLYSKATKLRQARYPDVSRVRSAMAGGSVLLHPQRMSKKTA